MVIGDLLQAGSGYAETFLEAVKNTGSGTSWRSNFSGPPAGFVRRMSDSLINFNVEISPESHDPKVRNAFGKSYGNAELEASIEALIGSACRRLDLFFMVGFPFRITRRSWKRSTIAGNCFAGTAARKSFSHDRPLAPFVDPGSRFFEEAERFGYRLFYRTLAEHRQPC